MGHSILDPDVVAVGWWHRTVRDGRVHDHPEQPDRSWPATMHRLCEPVYRVPDVVKVESAPMLESERVLLATLGQLALRTVWSGVGHGCAPLSHVGRVAEMLGLAETDPTIPDRWRPTDLGRSLAPPR